MPKVCPVCGASFTDANIFCPTDGSTLRAADAEGDLIGTVIADRYLITDLLGEGGMGKVYLARHVRLPQQAAIKVLRPAMLRDPEAIARFNREAANASRIEHERIARVFDYGESSDGTVYLAMEYVPGRTLKALLRADGAQTPERTATLVRQVADALDAAHRLGIVHRDLKPDNVMVIEDAELGDRCKVVDFGIAKAVGGGAGDQGLTKTGFVVGTPEFMSPEQLIGDAVDHRSDVYALALLAFQCLTGNLPFDSSTPERLMTARLVEAPMALAAVSPGVGWPAPVEAVFARGLARKVADRYASAGAFARDLAQAIASWQGGTVGASGSAIGTATESSIGQPFSAGVAPSTTPSASRPAGVTPTHSPSRRPLIIGGGLGLVAIAAVAIVLLKGGGDGTVEGPTADPATLAVTEQPGLPSAAAAPNPEGQGSSSAPQPASQPASQDAGRTPQNDTRQTPASSPTNAPSGTGSAAAPAGAGARNATSAGTEPSRPDPVRTPTAAASGSNSTGRSAAAKAELDSITLALDPLTATPAGARRGVAALRSLMPRLGSAEDSASAYLREAEAHFIMNDERSACVALQAARRLVRTGGQRGALQTMTAALSVSC